VIEADGCVVWWAALDSYRDDHRSILTPVEIERADRMRRVEDNRRSILAAALLRLAAAHATNAPPAAEIVVERTCPSCGRPHWRPTLPGTGLHASVSHSGDRVAVALTRVGPVGIDVERIGAVDTEGLSRSVLHPDEAAATTEDFYVYWTRKEAVVKATGDGIGAGLSKVNVSGPHQPPALLGYPERPDLAAYLADLSPGPGYKAALAVLVDRPVPVDERDAAALLAGVTPR
jgi:4'-phosphopantetheinyl transferase